MIIIPRIEQDVDVTPFGQMRGDFVEHLFDKRGEVEKVNFVSAVRW